MLDMLEKPAVTAILTAGLLLLTAVLAYFTARLAVEAKKSREASAKPEVFVSIEPGRWMHLFDIVVENCGKGPAHDLTIDPIEDCEIDDNGKKLKLSEIGILRVPVLKNGQRLSSFLAPYGKIPFKKASFRIVFFDSFKNRYEHVQTVDFAVYDHVSRLGAPPLEEMADALKKVSDALKSAVFSGKMRVDVYDRQDRELQSKRLHEALEEHKRSNQGQKKES